MFKCSLLQASETDATTLANLDLLFDSRLPDLCKYSSTKSLMSAGNTNFFFPRPFISCLVPLQELPQFVF